MTAQKLEFSVVDARTSLLPTPSAYVNRLIRPLHRGAAFEFLRDGLLNLSPVWRQSKLTWRIRNSALIRSIAKVSGARYVVDSSKTGVRLKYLRRIPDLEVRVIRLIRDGRAVALTYIDSDNFADAKDPAWRGGGTGSTARPNLSMEAAASMWLRSNLDADAVLQTIPSSDSIVITYEQLCADPRQTLASVYSFLGLEYSDQFKDFRAAAHHIVGNGMRLDDSSEIMLDERWKSVLTPDDLAKFDKVAGVLNRKYGYQLLARPEHE
jgi:hypothetical protein